MPLLEVSTEISQQLEQRWTAITAANQIDEALVNDTRAFLAALTAAPDQRPQWDLQNQELTAELEASQGAIN